MNERRTTVLKRLITRPEIAFLMEAHSGLSARIVEQVGVEGVTIEDKQFPKTNSFLRSELQPLADIDEFCGKIKAGKDSQTDTDFVLVARVEALIAGWGLAEAIKRAEAYHRAGADAILIHSRQSSPAEIFAFLDEWGNRAPVVLVPKAMLRVQGRPILARLLDDFAHFGCRDVTVVRGHHAAAVDVAGARFVDNREFAETGEAFSLALTEDALVPGTLVAFGDIVLKRHLIQAVLEDAGDGITLVVDSTLAASTAADRVRASRPDSGRFEFDEVSLVAIGDDVTPSHGAWIGLLHAGRDGAAWLGEAIAAARADGTLRSARLSDLITRVLADGRAVRVVYTRGRWANVNNRAALLAASDRGRAKWRAH